VRRFWRNLVLWAAVAPGYSFAGSGEEIDRLIAAVNGEVITEGDLRLYRDLNAVSSPGRRVPDEGLSEEIERLIDLEILRQEMRNFPSVLPPERDVDARLQFLRDAFAEIGGLPAVMRRLGLEESELRDYVALQISILRFVDFRFRPFVAVSANEVLSYYQDTLLPQIAKGADAVVPPLDEVEGKIEEILLQRKVDQALDAWLKESREHIRIERAQDGGAVNGAGNP